MHRQIVDPSSGTHGLHFQGSQKIKFFIGPPEGDIEEGLQLGLVCFESYQTLMILCTIRNISKF